MRRFWRCHIAVLVVAAISVHVLPPAPLAQATSVPTIPQRQGLLMSRYVLVASSNNELDDLEEELRAKGVVILHRQDDSAEATVLATQEQVDALADDRRVRSVEPDASVSSEIPEATHNDVIDGQYIVTLRSNATSSAQEKILNSLGAGVLYMYSQAIKGFAAELSLSQVSALRQNPNVLAVEKDRVLAITESQSGATWGLDRINQAALPLDGIFSYQASGSGVTAYVIDSGVQASHPNFGGRVGAGYGYYAQTDCSGHGTHVAGTVGSSTYGVAKSVQIVPVQVLGCDGSGLTSGVIAGMDWVVSHHVAGVKAVANMSLGGSYSAAVNAAVQRMVNDGIVVVVAAGNETANACNVSPASAPAAITVGASTSNDYRAYFSNYGSCLDIFAPGQSITSTVMGSSFGTESGTSMASPHVAGAAAILWSLHPEWTASEVSSSLIAAAIPNTVQNAGSGSPTSLLYVSPSATAPTAPTINSVTGSDERLTVAFTAPVSNGGAVITNYEYSTDNGSTWEAFSPATTSTPLVITMRSDIRFDVVNGVTYQVMVRAVNSAGSGAASAAMAGKPFTVAGAPTINAVTGSDERLTVAFTAPVSNGGATITNYEYSSDNGSTWEAFSPATTSTPLEITQRSDTTGKTVSNITTAGNHTCAALSDGTAACWGDNGSGRLGNGATIDSTTPVAVNMSGALAGKTVTNVTAGYWHTCAVTADGNTACWGSNYYGKLGNGTTIDSTTPVAVTGGALTGKTVTKITPGYSHTCAVLSDGTAACWGDNDRGTLGNGTTTGSYTPVAVTMSGALAGKTVTKITAGAIHTCALLSDGTAACWGYNYYGQLGNGTTTNSTTPVAVTGGALTGKTVTNITAGAMHTCALLSDGTAACWGYNGSGQLGNGATIDSTTPVAVTGGALTGKTVTNVSAGEYHTCAVRSDGTAACWGWNGYGQLGNGATIDSTTPVAVTGGVLTGKTVTNVTAGSTHTCALLSDGTATCWGDNDNGQLGNGTTIDSATPVAVTGGALTVPSDTTGALVNGTTYEVMVRAVNSAGSGAASAVMTGVPFTVAGAPTINSVTASDEQLTVAFTAPSSDGGATITNYEYSTDNGSTWKAFSPVTTSTPLLITQRSDTIDALVNGTTYEVMVRAVNSAGGGVASAVMTGVPFTVAGAPTINSVTGSDKRLTVAFTAPSSDGGATITNYEYSTDNGSTWKAFSPVTTSTPLLITQRSDTTGTLVNGTSYRVLVRAVNSAGGGVASGAMSGKAFTVAGAPTINSVTAKVGQLIVAFTAPMLNGGATITNYEYSTNNGSTWKAFSPADTRTPLVITKRSDANKNLVKGTTYQVRVRAVNAAGRGVASTLRTIKAR